MSRIGRARRDFHQVRRWDTGARMTYMLSGRIPRLDRSGGWREHTVPNPTGGKLPDLPGASNSAAMQRDALRGHGGMNGGAEGDRTLDLRIANATLSQLSYRPIGNNLLLFPLPPGSQCRPRNCTCFTANAEAEADCQPKPATACQCAPGSACCCRSTRVAWGSRGLLRRRNSTDWCAGILLNYRH